MTPQRRITTIAAVALTIAFVGSMVFFALRADGREGTEATTNDGGAWLVNQRVGAIGHVNRVVRELSAAVRVADTGGAIEVHQPKDAVVAHDHNAASITLIDHRTHALLNTLSVPSDARIFEFDDGIVITSQEENHVWRVSTASLGSIQDLDAVVPLHQGGLDALSVRSDGFVLLAAEGTLSWFEGNEASQLDLPEAFASVDDIVIDGQRAVLRAGNRIAVFADGRVSINPQQTAPWEVSGQNSIGATGSVLAVDVDGQLLRFDVRSGSMTVIDRLDGAGPVPPLEHAGCTHALTNRPALLVHHCENQPPVLQELTGAPANPNLRLRLVNGWVWVNDLTTGALWLVDDELKLSLVDDWGAVLANESSPEEDEGSSDSDDQSIDRVENPDNADAERVEADEFDEDGINQPPVAQDDDGFQTHKDRPIVVNLVANDEDPDNDVLLVTDIEPIGAVEAAIVRTINGTGVQVTPVNGFTGTIRFRYTVTDGRGGSDTATATVVVRDRSSTDNRAPIAVTDIATVTAGQKAYIDVLLNDRDPDGDSLVVVDASTPTGVVSFDPAGRLIFEPGPASDEGEVELTYVIEDDFGERTEGIVRAAIRLKDSNQRPDARNDGATTAVAQPVSVNLLANDTDPDGDDLFVSQRPVLLSPLDVDPVVSVSPDGDFVFIPDAAGTYVFSYVASDDEDTDTAQVRIDVTEPAENQPPVAIRDDAVIPLGESRIVYALQNDGDPDGDIVGIVDTDVPSGSGLRIEPYFDIGFRVFVEGDGPPRRIFYYSISDGRSDPVQAIVVVAIADAETENQPPQARGDTVEVRPGSAITVPVLANDFDPEGGALRVIEVGDVPGARVEVGPDGQSVRIFVDDTTQSSFTVNYDVEDELGNRTAAVIRVSVVARGQSNRAPIAVADNARVPFETEVAIPVTLNDSDPDGDAIRVESIDAQPEHGVATIDQATGEVRYRPERGYSGTDRLSYTIVDAFGAHDTGEVLIGVMPPPDLNRDPRAQDDLFQTVANGSTIELTVLVNDSDPDGDQIEVVDVSSPQIGTINFDDRLLTYTAPFNQPTDEVVTVTYVLGDERGGRDEATITIQVQATPNREDGLPIAVDDQVGPVFAGEPVRIAVAENDYDPDAPINELTVTTFDPAYVVEGQDIVFTAPGESTTFVYQITDVDGNAATATVELDVIVPLPPIAVDDVTPPYRAGEEILVDVLLNDADPDGDPENLQVISVDGTARIRNNMVSLIAPAASVDLRYTIEDEQGETASATVSVIVVDNRAPQLIPGVAETAFETSVGIDVGAFASDPDGDTLFFTCCRNVRGGSPQILSSGADELIVEFIPDSGFSGDAFFSYEVNDQLGTSAAGSVTVAVGERPNRAPSAVDSAVTMQKPRPDGPPITTTVDLVALSDDLDRDDTLRWEIVQPPANNLSAELVSSGVVEITATDASSVGETLLVWEIEDNEGASAAAVITIALTEPDNDPPVANSTSITVPAGEISTVNLAELSVDDDPNEILTWAYSATPPSGVAISQTGSATLSIAAAFNAQNTSLGVDYTVTDRLGEADTATINVSITDPDLPLPVAIDDDAQTLQGIAVTVPVLSNDLDPIGSGLRVIDSGSSTNGSISLVGDAIRFTPNPAFFGSTTFTYRIRDASDRATRETSGLVTIEVTGRPDAPSAPACETDAKRATLTWTTPANNGAPITEYELQHDDGGVVTLSPTNSHQWRDLTNGQPYRFRLRATNQAGTGDFSTWSVACIPDQIPERPAQPRVTHGDGWLDISWDVPNNEGTEITEYEIRIGGGNVLSSIDTTYRWPDLTNGTDYTFQVAARNERGRSDFSPASEPEHPSTIPDAPTILATTRPTDLVGTQLSGLLQVNWTPVPISRDGGDPVIEYVVRRSDGQTAIVPGAAASSYVWSGLENGVPYTFTVEAINRDGNSPASAASTPAEPCTVPDAPFSPSATAGDKSANITFEASPDDGGCRISGYEVRATDLSASTTTTGTSATLTGLENGRTYAFEIRAQNAIGSSFWVQTNAVVPKGRPICATNFRLLAISLVGADLAWDPANANGGENLWYEQNKNNQGWTNIGNVTGLTIIDLVADTSNSIAIRAVNEIGPSSECGSVTFNACPPAPPAPNKPDIGTDQVERSITTSWNAVLIGCTSQPEVTNDFDVVDYEIDVDHNSQDGAPYGGGPLGLVQSTTFTDLYYEDTMRVRVRACYATACGDWSPWSDTAEIDPVGTIWIEQSPVPDFYDPGNTAGINHPCADVEYILSRPKEEDQDPDRGCYFLRVTLSGWHGIQEVNCFYKPIWSVDRNWVRFATAQLGNGTHDVCSFSAETRRVYAVVNGTIEGQSLGVPEPPAVRSNGTPRWPED